LGLPADSGFPEIELPAIPRAENSPDYLGLDAQWYLYPVVISLDQNARNHLQNNEGMHWWTLKEVRKNCLEPNMQTIVNSLQSGERAFNLRVADPYLPYQKQGLGFTWSLFTPKDKQDVHVHGLPAVEIYGVLEGQLQIWYKPLSERGVRTWQCQTLYGGDWAEVEPLMCHFACWVESSGIGTVIKSAGSGELAGVGRLGVSGKTTCKDCNMAG